MHPPPNAAPFLAMSCAALALCLSGCSAEEAQDGQRCDDSAKLPAVNPSPDCDPLLPDVCAMPWPSSYYLVDDSSRKTGSRLALGLTTLPVNQVGKHAVLTDLDLMDGFGVGSPIVVRFPGLDDSGLSSEEHTNDSVKDDSKTLLFEVAGDKLIRVPHFTELDQTALKDEDRSLFIRPAVLLKESTRYIVALRGLTDKKGEAFKPSKAFAALRDCATKGSYLQARQKHFDEIFALLEKDGLKRDELLLAWDFGTASNQAMHEKMLYMRKKAFEIVGEKGPELTIDKIKVMVPKADGSGKAVDTHIALSIEGTFKVPSFVEPITIPGPPGETTKETGYVLKLGKDGMPVQNGWRNPKFWVQIPYSALKGDAAGLLQYGHGLLGTGSQVRSGWLSVVLEKYNYVGFGCNWTGMSSPEKNPIVSMVFDFSDFRIIPEHMHQGYLESILLARAMRERFGELAKIKTYQLSLDPKRLYYYGNSQGGIYGGVLMALSPDIKRGVLGVTGQNYSTLLYRSLDFAPFMAIMRAAYDSATDRALVLSAAQVLWDMADPVSYYRHIKAEPFADTPSHDVLLTAAQGDCQVAPMTNEIVARSKLGIALMKNYGKTVQGVSETAYPHAGSGYVLYHFGNPWPKEGNMPPPHGIGDPHEWPRRLSEHNEQLSHFLETGEIMDVCGGKSCDFAPPK